MTAARMCHTNILKLLPYDQRAICWAANDSCFDFLYQQRDNQPPEVKATPEFLIVGSVVANNLFVVRKLLSLGFDIDSIHDGFNPLHISIKHNLTDMFEFLLRNGANVNLRCQSNTPLHLAVTLDSDEKVNALLKFGADCNAKSDFLFTPLHCAVRCASLKVIVDLIEYEAVIEAEDSDGFTPLQFAVRYQREEVVDILLDVGCNVTSKNKHSSVLHEAVAGGNLAIVRKIISNFNDDEFCANLDVRDSTGDTPLMWAIESKNVELVVELLRFGANPLIKNATGINGFDWAWKVDDLKILNVLFIYCENVMY